VIHASVRRRLGDARVGDRWLSGLLTEGQETSQKREADDERRARAKSSVSGSAVWALHEHGIDGLSTGHESENEIYLSIEHRSSTMSGAADDSNDV
jgi:hypothetical protein